MRIGRLLVVLSLAISAISVSSVPVESNPPSQRIGNWYTDPIIIVLFNDGTGIYRKVSTDIQYFGDEQLVVRPVDQTIEGVSGTTYRGTLWVSFLLDESSIAVSMIPNTHSGSFNLVATEDMAKGKPSTPSLISTDDELIVVWTHDHYIKVSYSHDGVTWSQPKTEYRRYNLSGTDLVIHNDVCYCGIMHHTDTGSYAMEILRVCTGQNHPPYFGFTTTQVPVSVPGVHYDRGLSLGSIGQNLIVGFTMDWKHSYIFAPVFDQDDTAWNGKIHHCGAEHSSFDTETGNYYVFPPEFAADDSEGQLYYIWYTYAAIMIQRIHKNDLVDTGRASFRVRGTPAQTPLNGADLLFVESRAAKYWLKKFENTVIPTAP